MRLLEQLNIRSIYRVTGTPENFLTALRYKIWGFNNQNQSRWAQLEPGSIIFFHCKKESFFSIKPKSVVIGFGVVGNSFFEDNTPLWIDEKTKNFSYPFRFLFSEIYLFADIPINDDWDSTSFKKNENTLQILQRLVDSGIPLNELERFPYMGSYSSIKDVNVQKQLIDSTRKLTFYQGDSEEESMAEEQSIEYKSTPLKEISDKNEAIRHSTTLTIFTDVNKRIIKDSGNVRKNNVDALNLAEDAHYRIIDFLFSFLQDKGFKLFNNNHVDMFAYKQDCSMLIEAKSIENKNFISQSRKGLIQLFEYNYFEVDKFIKGKDLKINDCHKVLATSREPDKQKDYVGFINSMDIKTIAVRDNTIVEYGKSINFYNL